MGVLSVMISNISSCEDYWSDQLLKLFFPLRIILFLIASTVVADNFVLGNWEKWGTVTRKIFHPSTVHPGCAYVITCDNTLKDGENRFCEGVPVVFNLKQKKRPHKVTIVLSVFNDPQQRTNPYFREMLIAAIVEADRIVRETVEEGQTSGNVEGEPINNAYCRSIAVSQTNSTSAMWLKVMLNLTECNIHQKQISDRRRHC